MAESWNWYSNYYMNIVYFKTGWGEIFLMCGDIWVIYILYFIQTLLNAMASCSPWKSKALLKKSRSKSSIPKIFTTVWVNTWLNSREGIVWKWQCRTARSQVTWRKGEETQGVWNLSVWGWPAGRRAAGVTETVALVDSNCRKYLQNAAFWSGFF